MENRVIQHGLDSQLRVIIGPSFSIWEPSAILDRTFAKTLEDFGCEVIPVYCDAMQEPECNYVGGKWGGGKNFAENCRRCKRSAESLWGVYGHGALKLSKYITPQDRLSADKTLEGLHLRDMLNFSEAGFKYGQLAKDILVNNYLVATAELVPNAEHLLKTHIKNLMTLKIAYEKILQEFKPDRVVSNDSYYGMWHVLEVLCVQRGIPFYSHWPVTKERFAIAKDDAAMNLDFRLCWEAFSKVPLSDGDRREIDCWLRGERNLIIDHTKPANNSVKDPAVFKIDPTKESLLLAANVIWDVAALNKQIIFQDMIEWVVETIEWFIIHPNYQLIIKPHPVESSPSIPRTVETVEFGITSRLKNLPKNIILLNSNTHISTDELHKLADIRGVVVHTTTVGFEFPAQGLPAITTAKAPYRDFGFTIDPNTKSEYFSAIESLMVVNREPLSSQQQELAKKYIKLYQFHYYIRHQIFEGLPPRLTKRFHENNGSASPAYSYVIDKILKGDKIFSATTWPPSS